MAFVVSPGAAATGIQRLSTPKYAYPRMLLGMVLGVPGTEKRSRGGELQNTALGADGFGQLILQTSGSGKAQRPL